eukprot:4364416-Pyramimonas_sp.AAC.2
MSSNWKMDPGVAESCKEDVDKVCAAAKNQHGGGMVLKCLAENHDSLSSSDCQSETARATKMALWQYRKTITRLPKISRMLPALIPAECISMPIAQGAATTEECDEDAQTLCPADFPVGGVTLKNLGMVSRLKALKSGKFAN